MVHEKKKSKSQEPAGVGIPGDLVRMRDRQARKASVIQTLSHEPLVEVLNSGGSHEPLPRWWTGQNITCPPPCSSFLQIWQKQVAEAGKFYP